MLAILVPGVRMGGGRAPYFDPNADTWLEPARGVVFKEPARGLVFQEPARGNVWPAGAGGGATFVPLLATVTLVEPLGQAWEAQVAALTTTTRLGFTPQSVTLAGVAQTFQVGADGSVLVLTALAPYQTLTYTLNS